MWKKMNWGGFGHPGPARGDFGHPAKVTPEGVTLATQLHRATLMGTVHKCIYLCC